MHGSVLGFFAYGALQNAEVAGKDVLEVGSLDVNGSVRPFVMARSPASYVGVDVVDGPGVDRVADAEELWRHFDPDSFDVVISTEMLEHADNWRRCVSSMATVLRPGGVLVITTRSPGFGWHHPPDRWRYTQQAMAAIIDRLGLELIVLMDDPEYPGVFCKARKPQGWAHPPDRLEGVQGVTPVHEPLKILGLPANPDGCGYHRFWQPYAQLQQRSGHTVVIPPPGRHGFLPDEDEIAEFDVVARQRANGRAWLRAWRRWKQDGLAKLVYEVDDHILDPDQTDLPDWLADEVQETVIGCLELADLVTCSTDALAAELARYNEHVTVIPNFVHEDLLAMERPRRERVTIGWAGGFTHLQDLVTVQQPLKDLLHGLTDPPDLHMVGHDYRSLVGHVGRFTPWQVNVWDYYAKVDFDIGIAPLYDTAFNRCRSPIKALELAALGVPVVASDLDPYREFVVDGVTGYLCQTEADWYGRLRDLVHDEAMRTEMGAKAKEQARGWTIQEGWRRWADAYETLAGWPSS